MPMLERPEVRPHQVAQSSQMLPCGHRTSQTCMLWQAWASVPTGMAPSTSGRLFSFGIISDVQYADIPDGRSFKGVQRFYRAALPALQRAVQTWRARDVDFGMHFGAPPVGSSWT